MSYVNATDQNFNDILKNSNTPIVVDFWAPWCGPCKMLTPIFEKISEEYEDEIKFLKVNVDENPATAIKYNIQWIPSILVFKDNQVLKTLVWVKPEQEYKMEFDQLLWENSNTENNQINEQKWWILNAKWIEAFTNALEDNKDKLVIVDFWAPWCGPCRMLAPTLEKISEEYKDKLQIVKVNVDEPENQQLAMQFQVSSIPAIAFIKDWENPEMTVGALPYEQLKKIVEKKLS